MAPSQPREGVSEIENTFPKLLLRNARERPRRPAIRHKDLGVWQSWDWGTMLDEVRAFALGLEALGLEANDTVAVVGVNRPRLYWAMTAAQGLGAVPVPVYADAIADEMAYVLEHAGARFAVVQDQEQVDKILSVADRLGDLTHIIYDEERGLRNYGDSRLTSVVSVQALGRERLRQESGLAAQFEERVRTGRGDAASVILYTSGTTGRSKGVTLTAERCIAAARDTVAFDRLTDRDVALAYLPLAWVGDHYMNYAQGMVAGFCIACPESAETVNGDLREIGPSFYFAPPRVFENLLTSVMIRIEDAGAPKRRIFHHFVAVAKRHGERLLNGERVAFVDRLHYELGRLLVYGPLKNVLGFSRIRVAYTAGEAIGPDLFSFYRSLGINLKQLYGQTEAFLYISAHADGDVRADTVGPPMTNVDLRLAEDGEVQFRSPGMFVGYHKDEAQTRKALTPDGYVKTGDAGFFTEGGQLKIIDRAKDVGRLRDGSLFAPKYIENKLKFFPNIKEAVAFGAGRDYVTAFINIDLTAVGNWAERNNVVYGSYQELAGLPDVYDMIEANVARTNADLALEPTMAGAQIRRFLILHKELDPDDGELTRTQKVRRAFIAERYADLIQALYDGSSERDVATEVTFEDGRKGVIRARVKIRDMGPLPTELREAAE